ncbi:TPM domain-containing protein [Pelagerythrobacter marinus]|uniref:TPM domain-containing protein n=1 Tax=Pelagerythrobacter marinus TaxID=538382 RepID=UPI002AC94663|nr:TPM domain-containing protein [Pelagerythrobacter marinus]WPZ07353.1 TPM domain-containing protein [Pelagerythrobacter marinus]
MTGPQPNALPARGGASPALRGALCLLLALAGALALALPAGAQDFPERGTAPVVDAANIIDPATEAELTEALDAFEQRTQRQFAIATIPDLQGYDIADYGYRLGREWGLGDAENNDGIILIVAPNERRMRIEVGYGLEGVIPDGLAFEYIEEMKPFFRDGDYSAGIALGAQRIMDQLELPPEEAARVAAEAEQSRESEGGFPFGALIWLAFVFMFFVLPMLGGGRRRRYRRGVGGVVGDIVLWEAGKAIARGLSDDGWGGGGGFGGGGGGFGGFSGGGGSFGGGGASGGW